MSGREKERVDIRLLSPFTAVLAGPTGCGKTKQMMRLIDTRNEVCTVPPTEVLYCYGAWQPAFERNDVTFIEGMLDFEKDIPNDGQHRWLVIDDLMDEVVGKKLLNTLYTKYSHHRNVSVFFIVQNVFVRDLRTVSLNTQYFWFFKNPRDKQTIDNFARQAYPGRVDAVRQAFRDATSRPYSCLLWNMRQEADDRHRLIGNFAAADSPMIVYDVTGI